MRIIALVLLSMGLLFFSCKNRESEDPSIKSVVVVEAENKSEPSPEFAKLLDRLENFILTDYLTERDLRTISKDQRKFQLYQIDLNNDGKNEIFVNFVTSYFCGSGGCSVLLLNNEMQPISEFTVMQIPIYVEDVLENGWKVLMVQSEGKWRKLVYENGSYPTNPSLLEISRESSSKTATVLFDNENTEVKTYSF